MAALQVQNTVTIFKMDYFSSFSTIYLSKRGFWYFFGIVKKFLVLFEQCPSFYDLFLVQVLCKN